MFSMFSMLAIFCCGKSLYPWAYFFMFLQLFCMVFFVLCLFFVLFFCLFVVCLFFFGGATYFFIIALASVLLFQFMIIFVTLLF